METVAVNTKTNPIVIGWSIDRAYSEVAFNVKHLMVANVRGVFKEFDAEIYTNDGDFLGTEINFWLNPASVDTGDAERDNHLKSVDFFDCENYKKIEFTSNSYQNVDNEGSYEFYGDLTIKGITKNIKLDVEVAGIMKDQLGNNKAAFTINGKINRKDWGLNWNTLLDGGGVLLSDYVWINCEIQLIKQSQKSLYSL